MNKRALRIFGIAAIAALMAAGTIQAEYSDDEGFFVFLDAALTTPHNTDQVVANSVDIITSPQTMSIVEPDWGAGTTERLGFGYEWAGGSKITVSYWQFDDDEEIAAEGPYGGFLNFAIGPATYDAGYLFAFGSPGSADFVGSVKATTADIAFSREVEMGDFFDMEWHVGLRYATFEDRLTGSYDVCASDECDFGYYSFGEISFDAEKSNKGEMIGFRAGMRGTFFLTDDFAVSSGLAYSMLQGDLTSRSGLTPTGTFNQGIDPPTHAYVEDDTRSGNIMDFDIAIEYYLLDDRLRLALGYEHSLWDGIPEDMLRNTPGLYTTLDERDSVAFSGYRLGLRFRF